jgi:hypothetical protein
VTLEVGTRIFLKAFLQPRLLSNMKPGEGVKQSKCVEEPYHHANDNHCVQDRLDGTCHRDELVDEPEDYPDDDQRKQYLN